MLLNSEKYQGYSFYQFWVLLKENQQGATGDYPSPPPTQTKQGYEGYHYNHIDLSISFKCFNQSREFRVDLH